MEYQNKNMFLISNFRHVLNVVCFLLGNSPASEIYMPTFRNTVCSIFIGHRNRQSVPKRWHIKFRRRGITQKKAYNICHANFRSEFAESRFAAISQIKSSIVNYSDQVLQVFNYEQHNC